MNNIAQLNDIITSAPISIRQKIVNELIDTSKKLLKKYDLDTEIEDSEDMQEATLTLKRIKSGKEKTKTLNQVRKELGL